MAFGITAVNAHLNARRQPPDPIEINWEAYKTWNKGQSPDFAGRYFLGQPYLWAHGEAAAAKEQVNIGLIAPIQRSDPIRQKSTGDDGQNYGQEDAFALCTYIDKCISMGELSIQGKFIAIYLEVEDDTKLSEEYWTAWCSTICDYMVISFKDVVIGGNTVSMPIVLPAFFPCICCKFTRPDTNQKYRPITEISDVLENAGRKLAGKQTRCYGFWARVTDIDDYHIPEPNLDWKVFTSYTQPQGTSGSQPVPVLIWRYMDAFDPQKPENDHLDKFTLDGAYDPSGRSVASKLMLKVEDWKLKIQVNGNDAVRAPEGFGIDRGRSVTTQIQCFARTDMRIRELPATLNNHGISVDLQGKTSFAIRYYSAKSGSPSRPKDLKRDEAQAISRAGAENVACWEARSDEKDLTAIPRHLLKAKQGFQDALAALDFAANGIGQPAYTPIYFAVDALVSDQTDQYDDKDDQGNVVTIPVPHVDQIILYFQDVQLGYQQYLQNQTDAGVEPRPYYIGVYASNNVLDACYIFGLASHFWQAWPPGWGDKSGDNIPVWPHDNIWQILLWNTHRPEYWDQNKAIQECAGAGGVDLDIAWGDVGGWKI